VPKHDTKTDGQTELRQLVRAKHYMLSRVKILMKKEKKTDLWQKYTSWLETSAWSSRVIPSPMADFISRDNDGKTLIGG